MAKTKGTKAEKAVVEKAAPVEKAPKEKATKGPGIIATIIESIKKKPLTKAEIHQILVSKFPDRQPEGMRATVSIQLGPTRLGSKFKLLRDGDRFHIAG